jgi:hypothetical protein
VVITQPDLQRLLPASIPLHTLMLHPDKAAQAAPCGSLLPPACLGAAGSTAAAAWEAGEMDSWLDSSMVAAEPGCVLYGAAGCTKGQANGMLITHAGETSAILLRYFGTNDANIIRLQAHFQTTHVTKSATTSGEQCTCIHVPCLLLLLHHLHLPSGLAAYAASFKSHFGIAPADMFVQAAPSHAAASIDELWGCLAAGAALVLAPPELHKDANAFMQLIAR